MTELRDARLRRALDEAPDADLRPLARTRDAVLAAAHAAVERPRPWWQRFWMPAPGGKRMAWTPALATVLIAGMVTVLWQGQEPPPAQPEAVREVAKVEAQAREPKVEKEEVAAAPASKAPVEARVAAARPQAQSRTAVAHAPAAATKPPPPRVAVHDQRERQDAAAAQPVPPVPSAPTQDLAKQAERAEERALAAAPVPAAAAPAPAPAAAPAPAPAAAARAAPAAQGFSQAAPRRDAAASAWSTLRLEGGGKTIEMPRSQAGGLAQDIERLIRRPNETPFAEAVELRVRLSDGPRILGTLVLGASQAGWLAGEDAKSAVSLPAAPALVQSVRSEVERLLKQ